MNDADVDDLPPEPEPIADPAAALSRAAHDLNNLCASILGFAALTQESLDASSPLQDYLKEILAAAQKTTDVAGEMRRLARQLRPPREGGNGAGAGG